LFQDAHPERRLSWVVRGNKLCDLERDSNIGRGARRTWNKGSKKKKKKKKCTWAGWWLQEGGDGKQMRGASDQWDTSPKTAPNRFIIGQKERNDTSRKGEGAKVTPRGGGKGHKGGTPDAYIKSTHGEVDQKRAARAKKDDNRGLHVIHQRAKGCREKVMRKKKNRPFLVWDYHDTTWGGGGEGKLGTRHGNGNKFFVSGERSGRKQVSKYRGTLGSHKPVEQKRKAGPVSLQ